MRTNLQTVYELRLPRGPPETTRKQHDVRYTFSLLCFRFPDDTTITHRPVPKLLCGYLLSNCCLIYYAFCNRIRHVYVLEAVTDKYAGTGTSSSPTREHLVEERHTGARSCCTCKTHVLHSPVAHGLCPLLRVQSMLREI